MNLSIENKLQQIYDEKQTKLIPSNIKMGEEILGIRGNYTKDATATASNILNGYTAYVNGSKLTGTMPNNGTLFYNPTTEVQNIPAGYTTGGTINAVTSSIDSNITTENIRSGVTILGINGDVNVVNTYIETNAADADNIAWYKYAYVNGQLINGRLVPAGDYVLAQPINYANQVLTFNTKIQTRSKISGSRRLIITEGVTGIYQNIPNSVLAEAISLYSNSLKQGTNILDIEGNYTSDATATPNDIIGTNKTAYVNGQKINGKNYFVLNNNYTSHVIENTGIFKNSGRYFINSINLSYTVLNNNSFIQSQVPQEWIAQIENLTPDKLKQGVKVLNITGTLAELKGTNLDVILSNVNQSITPQSPYNAFTVVNIPAVTANIDNNIQPANIKYGTNILGITGNLDGIKTYNSVNDMNNDTTAIADHSYGIELRSMNSTTYVDIDYDSNRNNTSGFNRLNIVNSFTNTASRDISHYIGPINCNSDYDIFNSHISINSTNAYITIIGLNNECLLDAQYTSLDGNTYNISSLTGSCVQNNQFYYNVINLCTLRMMGEWVPQYDNTVFNCFLKPMEVQNITVEYPAALYKYDGTNWNKLMDKDDNITTINTTINCNLPNLNNV